MSMESPSDEGLSPRADLFSALFWMAVGAAIAIASWRMDRLEHLHINRHEVPGLVPGLLGLALLGLGLALALRALRQGVRTADAARPAAPAQPGARVRMLLVLGAMLVYPLVLVGHGLPFWLATLLFVSAFVYLFDGPRQAALGRTAPRRLLFALVCGGLTAAIVSTTFQDVFYVRLP